MSRKGSDDLEDLEDADDDEREEDEADQRRGKKRNPFIDDEVEEDEDEEVVNALLTCLNCKPYKGTPLPTESTRPLPARLQLLLK